MFGLNRKEKRKLDNNPEDDDHATSVTTLAHSPETRLEEYLAYYVSQKEPGYAVLITGDWGTGKTYQITSALPTDHAHYISLFGLNSSDEIEAQVFAKMYPKKASLKKLADKLSTINVGVPGYGSLGVNGLTSVLASTFIKNEISNSKPLIFDDLERCSVANRKVLGLINRYVEHHKCRVIVIAHDTKLVDQFRETKEKVFGQTLAVEPNVEAAFTRFNTFFARQDEVDRLGDLMNEVLSIFRESDARSLRVLRHVIEDVRRLAVSLDDRHIGHRPAMVELIRLFSALAIEARTNSLDKEFFRNRRQTLLSHQFRASRKDVNHDEPPAFVKSSSKYKSIDLSNPLLNDTVLIEMLIEGHFVPEHIQASVNASAYFLEKEMAPSWQIVSGFATLDDNTVDAAVTRMDEQFAQREITESGELLHIVALQMMMASKEITMSTVRQVTNAAKAYIDDLLTTRRLPPRTVGWRWFDSFESSYAGIQYWVEDTYKAEFKEVFDHLIEARSKALETEFPTLIPALIETLKNDGQRFFEETCHTRNGIAKYEDIPILAHIHPKDFVAAWTSSPKSGWYWIGSALKERNKATATYRSLRPEIEWFPLVAEELKVRAESETGLARLRIIRLIGLMGLPPE